MFGINDKKVTIINKNFIIFTLSPDLFYEFLIFFMFYFGIDIYFNKILIVIN